MNEIHTAAIVVTYNGAHLLPECLEALLSQTKPFAQVIVVDNGSSDTTCELLMRYPTVHLIANEKNEGFAKANNQGITHAIKSQDTTHIAVVNNDCVLHKKWHETLATHEIWNHATCGGTVGKILRYADHTIIDSAGDYIFKSRAYSCWPRGYMENDQGQYETVEETFSMCAAACLYSRQMLMRSSVKGEYLDNNFFAYGEDVELCMRARLLGWRFWYIPAAHAYHHGSSTAQIFGHMQRLHNRRNKIWSAIKVLPFPECVIIPLRYIFHRRITHNGKQKSPPAISWIQDAYIWVLAFTLAFKGLPDMLQKRNYLYTKKGITTQNLTNWYTTQALDQKE